MNTMKKIEKLLLQGKSTKEVIAMGYAYSTVYVVAKKLKSKTMHKDAENVEDADDGLEIYELIEQMARWIAILAIDSGFCDGAKQVPCLYCAQQGEKDFMMKLNEKEDQFECPRCGDCLPNATYLSSLATVYLVQERTKRGYAPPPKETGK